MMQGSWAGTSAVVLAGVAALGVVAPSGDRAVAGSADVRVSDVEVFDDGRVSVSVAVPGLRPADADRVEDFEVREDGQPRAVDATPVATSDVEVAVVVDSSAGQAPQQLREVQNIAMELALRLPDDAPMALVAAGDPPVVAQSATTDVLERAAATGRLQPRGERATYDALVLAVDALSSRPGARRSVVLVGSGDDEASHATEAEVRDGLGAANAALYVIHPPAADRADRLDDVVADTGGLVVPVADDRDPLTAAAVVLADVLHHYRLTFQARGRGDTTVSVRVATDVVSAETTVDVRLPTSREQATADTEVLGSSRSRLETAPNGTWLAAVAAAVSVTLVFAGAVLLGARRPAGHHPGAVGAGLGRGLGVVQAWRARAATADRRVLASAGAAVGVAVAVGTSLARLGGALRTTWAAMLRAGAAMNGRVVMAARRSATVVASSAVVVARTATHRLRGAVPAGHEIRRRLMARVGSVRRDRRPAPPVWLDVAVQVHGEVGGDWPVLYEAADRIMAARRHTAASLRAAGFKGRRALACITPLPVAVGVFRSVVDPAYLQWLTGGVLGVVTLGGVAALTAAGGLWLHRVAQPPFAALPASWRAHHERLAVERDVADALDWASMYVSAGLDLDSALERVQPHDWFQVASLLRPEDMPAVEALTAARERLQAGWLWDAYQQADRIAVSTLVPFVVCIVPAMAIAGLAGGS